MKYANPTTEPNLIACPSCNGRGEHYDDQSDEWGISSCENCNGSGQVVEQEPEKEFEIEYND